MRIHTGGDVRIHTGGDVRIEPVEQILKEGIW